MTPKLTQANKIKAVFNPERGGITIQSLRMSSNCILLLTIIASICLFNVINCQLYNPYATTAYSGYNSPGYNPYASYTNPYYYGSPAYNPYGYGYYGKR